MRNLLICLLLLLFAAGGCQKRRKMKKGYISKAELKKRVAWAKPNCMRMCRWVASSCRSFLKSKKRTLKIKACANACVNNFILSPGLSQKRIFCIRRAPSCEYVRSCNRCNFFFCKKKGKKWVPKTTPALMKKLKQDVDAFAKKMAKMAKAAKAAKAAKQPATKPGARAAKRPADRAKAPAKRPADRAKAPAKKRPTKPASR